MSDVKPPSEVRIQDPLSDVTRAERKTLLGLSAVGIVIAKSGLVPSKISALGDWRRGRELRPPERELEENILRAIPDRRRLWFMATRPGRSFAQSSSLRFRSSLEFGQSSLLPLQILPKPKAKDPHQQPYPNLYPASRRTGSVRFLDRLPST
jgi:hypothetical protein